MKTVSQNDGIHIQPVSTHEKTSSWLPPLFSGGLAAAGKWVQGWYRQAKETVQYALSGPEEPFFMKAQENEHYARFQAWQDELKWKLRQIKNTILSGEQNAVDLGERLLATQTPDQIAEHILSSVMYSWLLNQLEQDLRKRAGVNDITCANPQEFKLAANVIQKVLWQWRSNLDTDPELAEEYLCSDLFNAIILYSGDRISRDGLITILHYYQGLVDDILREQLAYLIEALPESVTDPNHPFDFAKVNRQIKSLLRNIQAVFAEYSDNLVYESGTNHKVAAETLLDTRSLSYIKRFNDLLETVFGAAKDFAQQGMQFIRQNPKTAFASVSSAAALSYLYCSLAGNGRANPNGLQPFQSSALTDAFPQWSILSWQDLPVFSFQTTNFLGYASLAFGMQLLVGTQATTAPVISMLMTAGLCLFLGPTLAQPIPVSFFLTVGGNNSDYGHDVQPTPDGGFIMTGWTQSFGMGNQDLLLAKFNESCALSWIRVLGGNNNEWGYSVQVTVDGGYIVTGRTDSFGAGGPDSLLAKFDGTGTLSWVMVVGGSGGDAGYSIQVTSDGGYIVTMDTWSYGAGAQDLLLTKFDGAGTLSWAGVLGGSGNDLGWSVQVTVDGGYIVTGRTDSFGAGSYDLLLARFNGTGSLNWAKVLGGSNDDVGRSVQVTTDQGSIVTGYTLSFGAGNQDLLLAKFNESGTLSWARVLGGSNDDVGRSVQVTTDRGYIVTGYTYSFGAGGVDLLLAKFGGTGTLNWVRVSMGSNWDYGISVQVTVDGGYIVTGQTDSFGVGAGDLLLAKFDANGTISNCSAFQDIAPTVQAISPIVSVIAPTVQIISPVVQSWNVIAVPISPIVQTHCEYFPPTMTVISQTLPTITNATHTTRTQPSITATNSQTQLTRTTEMMRSNLANSSNQETHLSTQAIRSNHSSSTMFSTGGIPSAADTHLQYATTDSTTSENPRSRAGLILGIIFGVMCALSLIALPLVYLLYRKTRRNEEDSEEPLEMDRGSSELTDQSTYAQFSSVFGKKDESQDKEKDASQASEHGGSTQKERSKSSKKKHVYQSPWLDENFRTKMEEAERSAAQVGQSPYAIFKQDDGREHIYASPLFREEETSEPADQGPAH